MLRKLGLASEPRMIAWAWPLQFDPTVTQVV